MTEKQTLRWRPARRCCLELPWELHLGGTWAKGELGWDAVTPEASVNNMGSSEAGPAVLIVWSWAEGVGPLYTCIDQSLVDDCHWKRGVTMGKEVLFIKDNP